ncbi:MAG: acyl-CoA dehydrogenase family protein [Candidatus Eisenbacteria bacterium]|uniref:Acyl-CoA dehydrogenase family protein n=1 Tax=Eiseniibacteriota bacterium TaxID=2212470 RepID=A0A956RPT1_UNCEI|nr:acyl-CoA dehydrogenase family protein [Candidatus Eisenbacteria bacterium]
MASPSAFDFYDVKSLLDEEERQIQSTVGRWVDERVEPVIADAFDAHRFPEELIPEIADLGLLGCTIDGYDCAGLNNVSYGLICQELERGDSGLRSFVSVQGSLCMYPIHAFGSEEQRQRWLPKMASAEAIGCFGLTEPDGGSDPGTMKTHAKKDGSDWILNGAKMWITNGGIAHLAIVWAMTDDGIRGFIVERGMKGFTTRDTLKKYSLRASITSELFFDSVRVPQENVLPEAKGLKAPLSCLTQARYGIAWGAIGAAIGSYKTALDFAQTRVLFGSPLTHKQTIQRRFAEMCRRITTAQLLALQLGRLKDQGKMHPTQVSMAKWNNVRMGLDVSREARDILGAGGISIEYSPIRHMLNLESVITYEGTETIHELAVGREICGGVNAF